MKPSDALEAHRKDIIRIVERHRGMNVRVFGSVLDGDDKDDSDLDLLVDPADGMTLLDVGRMRAEIRTLLGVAVDVVTPAGLHPSFRQEVLHEARAL